MICTQQPQSKELSMFLKDEQCHRILGNELNEIVIFHIFNTFLISKINTNK